MHSSARTAVNWANGDLRQDITLNPDNNTNAIFCLHFNTAKCKCSFVKFVLTGDR